MSSIFALDNSFKACDFDPSYFGIQYLMQCVKFILEGVVKETARNLAKSPQPVY